MNALNLNQIILIVAVVVAALAFDFINGFHDAANSIATIVSTRVLTPFRAVLWAAFFNFIAFALFKHQVASTIGKGIIDPGVVDVAVIVGALGGAIAWNLLTWLWGLPSSSSHALVGGLIGAGVSKAGLGILGWQKIGSTAAFIFLSPIIGFFASYLLASPLLGCSASQHPGAWTSGSGACNSCPRLLSASIMAATTRRRPWDHRRAALFQGLLGEEFHTAGRIPVWIVVACYLAMGLGTMRAAGAS